MTRRRIQLIVLAALLLTAGWIYLSSRNQMPGLPSVSAAHEKFQALSVREPQLRLEELTSIQKSSYSGTHRNIFIATPPPPEPVAGAGESHKPAHLTYGPQPPPPDPPLNVPAQFFGYAFSKSGHRVAFFTSGEDILVVPEGDTFLTRYRVTKIGSDSVDVDEVGTGRHQRLPMLQPANDSSAQAQPTQNQFQQYQQQFQQPNFQQQTPQ